MGLIFAVRPAYQVILSSGLSLRRNCWSVMGYDSRGGMEDEHPLDESGGRASLPVLESSSRTGPSDMFPLA